ncbi:MAG: prolyl oligopeptidase family serine peptidase [bacterium]|nr:prolyl oligopeptidase family serine peptidase [bacterium]
MTESRLHVLDYPDQPARVIRVRVETSADAVGAGAPHVIVVHGFKGFMHWGFFPELSRRIASAGYACVSLNVSGCGVGEDLENFTDEEGFAKNTHTREIEDIARVRAWLRSGAAPGVDPERGAIFGHSRGGGMVLLHAAEDGGYEAVVTWAAIDTPDRIDAEAKRAWRESGHLWIHNGRTGQDHRVDLDILEDLEQNRDRLDILAACGRLAAPTLVVHGTDDPTVEFGAAERIHAALNASELLRLEGAGHTFGAGHPLAGTTPDLERAIGGTLQHLRGHLGPPGARRV